MVSPSLSVFTSFRRNIPTLKLNAKAKMNWFSLTSEIEIGQNQSCGTQVYYLPLGRGQEPKLHNRKCSIRSLFCFVCGHMCLSNLDHRTKMLKRLWGFIKSTPRPMGRPPTSPPDTRRLTPHTKTSMKPYTKRSDTSWPASSDLACWICIGPTPPLINPTPASQNDLVASLNIPH